MMDLVRSWVIAAVVLVGVNFLLSLITEQHFSLLYLLAPYFAGLTASLYHAERGVGGWGRHLLAVLPVPAVVQAYMGIVQEGAPGTGLEWSELALSLAFTTLITALGVGTLMLARLLLITKDTTPTTPPAA